MNEIELKRIDLWNKMYIISTEFQLKTTGKIVHYLAKCEADDAVTRFNEMLAKS